MVLILISFLAATLYLLAGYQQYRLLSGKTPKQPKTVVLFGTAAVLLHTFAVYLILHPGYGIQLSFFPVSSLIAWLIAGLVLLSSLKKPLHNLFVIVFPLAAFCVILTTMTPATADAKPYVLGLVIHILSSILAYSIFTIAAIQAILLHIQNSQLRKHHTRGIVAALPPLQMMESLLFEMLLTGLVLLSVSLVTGVIFVEDIFAQHLVHKTALSIIAWLIYATILWGRHYLGWRGTTAVRWTLSGFVLLMLAFFGTKLVVELILH